MDSKKTVAVRGVGIFYKVHYVGERLTQQPY